MYYEKEISLNICKIGFTDLTYKKRVDGRVNGQNEYHEPGMQIRWNIDIGEGHDFQNDGGHPAQTIGENYKKETDGYFDFIGRQRTASGCPSLPDAYEKGRVHANNQQDATRRRIQKSNRNLFFKRKVSPVGYHRILWRGWWWQKNILPWAIDANVEKGRILPTESQWFVNVQREAEAVAAVMTTHSAPVEH